MVKGESFNLNEYVISFINDAGVYQQITLRGVTESVGTAVATGLLTAGFSQVALTAKEFSDRQISVLPEYADPVFDNPEDEGSAGE